jgi:hypothetical protein
MPRFVILAHDWPAPHFDLLFEVGGVLKAWRLAAEPGAEPVVAVPNFDHRPSYLDYEGPVTGDRGTVTRWDSGTYAGELVPNGWTVTLNGTRLRGQATLARTGGIWSFRVVTAPPV